MAKPNYAFQKRQRELAKKQKKEEKQRQKQAAAAGQPPAEEGAPDAPKDPSAPDELKPGS